MLYRFSAFYRNLCTVSQIFINHSNQLYFLFGNKFKTSSIVYINMYRRGSWTLPEGTSEIISLYSLYIRAVVGRGATVAVQSQCPGFEPEQSLNNEAASEYWLQLGSKSSGRRTGRTIASFPSLIRKVECFVSFTDASPSPHSLRPSDYITSDFCFTAVINSIKKKSP